jgi:hypothetical protein
MMSNFLNTDSKSIKIDMVNECLSKKAIHVYKVIDTDYPIWGYIYLDEDKMYRFKIYYKTPSFYSLIPSEIKYHSYEECENILLKYLNSFSIYGFDKKYFHKLD